MIDLIEIYVHWYVGRSQVQIAENDRHDAGSLGRPRLGRRARGHPAIALPDLLRSWCSDTLRWLEPDYT